MGPSSALPCFVFWCLSSFCNTLFFYSSSLLSIRTALQIQTCLICFSFDIILLSRPYLRFFDALFYFLDAPNKERLLSRYFRLVHSSWLRRTVCQYALLVVAEGFGLFRVRSPLSPQAVWNWTQLALEKLLWRRLRLNDDGMRRLRHHSMDAQDQVPNSCG